MTRRMSKESRQFLNAFVVDTFNTNLGYRVLLHERGQYPDVTKQGHLVDGGRYTEIGYQVLKKINLNTPNKRCIYKDERYSDKLTDLTSTFDYGHKGCNLNMLGNQILNRCGCFFASAMRPGIPNASFPYCGALSNTKLFSLLSCFRTVFTEPVSYTHLTLPTTPYV